MPPITDLTIKVLGPCRDLSRSVQAVCRRRLDDAAGTRHLLLHRDEQTSPRSEGCSDRGILAGRGPWRPSRRIFIRRSRISEKRSTAVSRSSRISSSFATARISSIPSFRTRSTQRNSSSFIAEAEKAKREKDAARLRTNLEVRLRALPRRVHGRRLRGLGRGTAAFYAEQSARVVAASQNSPLPKNAGPTR